MKNHVENSNSGFAKLPGCSRLSQVDTFSIMMIHRDKPYLSSSWAVKDTTLKTSCSTTEKHDHITQRIKVHLAPQVLVCWYLHHVHTNLANSKFEEKHVIYIIRDIVFLLIDRFSISTEIHRENLWIEKFGFRIGYFQIRILHRYSRMAKINSILNVLRKKLNAEEILCDMTMFYYTYNFLLCTILSDPATWLP